MRKGARIPETFFRRDALLGGDTLGGLAGGPEGLYCSRHRPANHRPPTRLWRGNSSGLLAVHPFKESALNRDSPRSSSADKPYAVAQWYGV